MKYANFEVFNSHNFIVKILSGLWMAVNLAVSAICVIAMTHFLTNFV